jgi:hypothetical protein
LSIEYLFVRLYAARWCLPSLSFKSLTLSSSMRWETCRQSYDHRASPWRMTQLYPRASTIHHYFCLVTFLFAGMNRVSSDVHNYVNLGFHHTIAHDMYCGVVPSTASMLEGHMHSKAVSTTLFHGMHHCAKPRG